MGTQVTEEMTASPVASWVTCKVAHTEVPCEVCGWPGNEGIAQLAAAHPRLKMGTRWVCATDHSEWPCMPAQLAAIGVGLLTRVQTLEVGQRHLVATTQAQGSEGAFMFEVGVQGDKFRPHRVTDECTVHGCVPAHPDDWDRGPDQYGSYGKA